MKNLQEEATTPTTTEAWVETESNGSQESSNSFLANPAVALFLLFWSLVVQTMLTSGAPAIVGPVLERRFGFTTTQVGALFSSIVVLVVIVYMPVTGLGRRRRPLFAAVGLFSIVAGSVLYILPEFVIPYDRSRVSLLPESSQLCSSSGNISRTCTDEPVAGVWTAFVLQALGRALMGFSSISLYSLAVAYLGDVAGPQRSSTYIGIYFGATAVGPALGILLSAEFLKLPADLKAERAAVPSGASTTGAWWLINVAGSALAILLMPLVALLPGKHTDAEVQDTRQPAESRSFLQGLKSIVTDPVKAMLLLAGAVDAMLPLIALSYSFKLLEIFFPGVDYATFIIAGLVVPIAGAGFLTGGFVIRRLAIRRVIKFCIIASAVTSVLFAGMTIHCDEPATVVGMDARLADSSGDKLTAACNSDCNCSRDQFQPVCGENQISYFSPCHAGCNVSGPNGFHNCACVEGNGAATHGECSLAVACADWKLPVAATFYALVAFGETLTKSPNSVTLMRLTEDEFKTVTVAISETGKLLTVLGVVPAVGALIDRSCLLWDTACGTTGSCLRYQRDTVARDFVLINVGFKVFSCVCYLVALLLYNGDVEVL